MTAPARIYINKVHGQHPEDWNFTDGQHLTKRQLAEKVEYVRADLARAPLADALAVPEVAALVEAVDSAFANVDAQIDDAGEFTSASWLALRHAVAGLWTLHPSQAALRAIGERAE